MDLSISTSTWTSKQTLTQIAAVEVLELAPLPHEAVGALAVVQDGVSDLHGEARRAVQAVAGGETQHCTILC